MVKPADIPVECVKDLTYINTELEQITVARKGRRYTLSVILFSADNKRAIRFLSDEEFQHFERVDGTL